MSPSKILSVETSTQLAVEEAELTTVPRRDWRRIRRRVASNYHPIPWAREAWVLCIGMVPTAGLGLATWAAAYSDLPPATQGEFWWVAPLMGSLLVGSIGIGIVAFLMDRQGAQYMKRESELICDDMDSIVPPEETYTASAR